MQKVSAAFYFEDVPGGPGGGPGVGAIHIQVLLTRNACKIGRAHV